MAQAIEIVRRGSVKIYRGNRKGSALVEMALIAPLLFPLLLAAFDFGMYTYAFISVQNAVRVAALRNSGGPDSAADQGSACAMVIQELSGLPNIGSSFQSSCSASPLVVASASCSATTACSGAAMSADGSPASAVTVQYSMPGVFTIPIVGPSVITRTAQMKIRNMQ
jgi:Flp pilus assembly protein TadG